MKLKIRGVEHELCEGWRVRIKPGAGRIGPNVQLTHNSDPHERGHIVEIRANVLLWHGGIVDNTGFRVDYRGEAITY